MTPTATADHNSKPAAPAAPTLSDAVRAVNEHRREVELRRMAHAARQSQAASDWMVPVPRSRLEALERQAREAVLLRRLLESEPASALSSGTQALAAERHLPSKPNPRRRHDARPAPSA